MGARATRGSGRCRGDRRAERSVAASGYRRRVRVRWISRTVGVLRVGRHGPLRLRTRQLVLRHVRKVPIPSEAATMLLVIASVVGPSWWWALCSAGATVLVIEQALAVSERRESRLAWGPWRSSTQAGRVAILAWLCFGLSFFALG